MVSIHAPVWGATNRTGGNSPRWWFQSTRPCGARQSSGVRSGHAAGVSIHAPVWGATSDALICDCTCAVSIHAPVWGATRTYALRKLSSLFQSTRPCGARPESALAAARRQRVSIHAPCGARPVDHKIPLHHLVFQSTRPCGARRDHTTCLLSSSCFNPRARVGRDCSNLRYIYSGTCMPVYANLTRNRVARAIPVLEFEGNSLFLSYLR